MDLCLHYSEFPDLDLANLPAAEVAVAEKNDIRKTFTIKA